MSETTVDRPTPERKGLTILRLSASNVKRLRAIEITPDGSPVMVIAGENEAGKSSVLDAIAYALGGKELVPARPVRDGEKKAEIVVDLGEFIVKRTFTPAGGGSLQVMTRDGAKYPSPQTLLDGLVGRLTFDPTAFVNMKPADQAATLRAIANIDTTDLEVERKKLFDERTLANRDLSNAQGAFTKAESYDDLGDALVVVSELTQRLAQAEHLASVAAEAEKRGVYLAGVAQAALDHFDALTLRRKRLQAELDALDGELATASMARVKADRAVSTWDTELVRVRGNVPDRTELHEALTRADDHNRKVRANLQKKTLGAVVEAAQARVEALTERIADLDAEKATLLKNATFPLPGLGLDADGLVLWNGVPFDQASTSIRLRASVAIGLALHPCLRVLLIRNGNDLGHANLAAIAAEAAAAGAQLWVERIEGGDALQTVYIEDGAVAGASQETK
jgi:chromosome segregation ATPase